MSILIFFSKGTPFRAGSKCKMWKTLILHLYINKQVKFIIKGDDLFLNLKYTMPLKVKLLTKSFQI